MPKAELYKISVADGKVMLRIPEQLVGAETADMDDIQSELHMMDVDYVPEELLDIYNRTSGEFDFLTDVKTTDFTLLIELSDDQSKAYLNVIPPKEIIEPLTIERVLAALREENVFQGFDREFIEKVIKERIYFEPVVVASGKTPVHGKNGHPELLFLPAKFRPSPESSINLRELPVMQKVTEGQELVRLEQATMGEDGYTITGKLITACSGKQYRIRPGRNTRFNAEGTHIIASSEGIVCLGNDSISVERIKYMDKVDGSVGRVRFDGIVSVRGNISDRCSVEAVRIEVGGSVGKASLRSIGDIKVAQGLKGTVVQCGGSLHAGNMVDTQASVFDHALVDEFILNSKVFCGSTLQVNATDGYACGGVLQAGNLIRLSNVGLPEDKKGKNKSSNEQEIPPQTLIEVGISLKNRKQFNELEKRARESLYALQDDLSEITALIEDLEKTGLDEEKIRNLGELEVKANKNVMSAFFDLRKREAQDEINELNKITGGGAVFITGRIPEGTFINVRRYRYIVRSSMADKAFRFSENGIQTSSCSELLKDYQNYFFEIMV
ncbi:FapA family protein [Deltaproteobacteria bacterium]|nr:FapA family protein [Deltaproteobacteria bacterium]